MVDFLKQVLYFPVAYYFRLFAQIQLRKWRPRVIVITGSTGKTTLLHLIEAQLGKKARYSHHANSAYGVPFHILGLERKTFTIGEWLGFFFQAPFCLLKKPPEEKLYVVEADCDRPGEGQFLASFLKPEVVLWVSVSKTHSVNFDYLVESGQFPSVEDAIAYEFGYFLTYTLKHVIVNGDSPYIVNQLMRTKAAVKLINKKHLVSYKVSQKGSQFVIDEKTYDFKVLLPEVAFYSLSICVALMKYLDKSVDDSFARFKLPPGRSSLFAGIKNTTIIDSTYNANLASVQAILDLFDKLAFAKKWAIIGDMLEQGKQEQQEHQKLADLLIARRLERVILVGPRTSKYTYPRLISNNRTKTITEQFLNLAHLLTYLKDNLQGDEGLLFKASQSILLEATIEKLLTNKSDLSSLPRQETVWKLRKESLFVSA